MGSDAARDGMSWDRPSNELALWAFFSLPGRRAARSGGVVPGGGAAAVAPNPKRRTRRCSRRRGHVGFLEIIAHSAPAAAELGR